MDKMTAGQRQDQISEQIWNRIDYLRKEYDVTFAEIIGVLELIKMDIYAQITNDEA